jgi:Kef-type K+ transport system membrane component KefB
MSLDVAFAIFVLAVCLFFSPLLAGRLRVPSAVVEIVLGVTVTALLGTLEKSGFVSAVGQMGMALVVFSAGAEVDLRRAAAAGPRTTTFVVLALVANWGGAAIVAYLLGVTPFFYMIAPAIAIALAGAVLRELDLLRAPVGQMTLILGGPGLVFTIALLAVVSVLTQHGWGPQAIAALLGLAGMFAVTLLVVFALRELVWWFPSRFARMLRNQDSGEIGLRVVMVMLFGFNVVSRHVFGLSLVLAAVLGGLAFGFVFRDRGVLSTKMSTFGYGFFIPVFFVSVGLTVKTSDLFRTTNLALIGTWLLISAAGRVPIAPLLRLAGLPWRQAIAVALFLSAPMSMVVAIATTGRDIGAIDESTYAAAIAFTVLCSVTCPSLARAILGGGAAALAPAPGPAVSTPALRPAG